VTRQHAALLQRSDDWRAELTAHGVRAGDVVVIEGSFSPNACAALLALIDLRAICVPITPTMAVHRDTFAEIAESQHHIVLDEDDAWTFTSTGRVVTHSLTRTLTERGNAGIVIFSSGSSGAHKAILHDVSGLLLKFQKARERKVTLTFLLFDHIGGLDTLFSTFCSGGTVVTTPTRDPETVCAAIAAHQVHTLPTSPTFLNLMLISGAWRTHDMSSLRVIAYGTEPMAALTLRLLGEALPDVRLVQTFGMSETGVLRSRSRDSGSLWMRLTGDGYEHKVVDGVLWVRSPSAMLGYLNASDLFDADGWLNTQDAVEVDGEFIRILGRVTDLINVGGQKVYPIEVETVLLQMENVRDVAAYGEPNPLTGQFVAARFSLHTPEPLPEFKRRMRVFCRDRLVNYQIPVRVEIVEGDLTGARYKKMRRV
jgi:long-chain acyl-CoA synthetase